MTKGSKKNTKNAGKKRMQGRQRFFDIEADEGADSEDDGRPKKGGADQYKDAYYKDQELKRRNKGLNEKIEEMEEKA